jgi:septal ring-binding cell division protein DamX
MKKKLLPMSMVLVGLVLGLSACGNKAATTGQDTPAPQENVAEAQETETVQEEEKTTAEAAESEEPEQAARPTIMHSARSSAVSFFAILFSFFLVMFRLQFYT